MRNALRLCLVFLCLAAQLALAEAPPVHLAVLAFRPKPETLQRWQPLVDHLNRAGIDRRFVLDAYTYPELEHAVKRRLADVVLTQPAHYVMLAHRYRLYSPLATLVEREGPHLISQFGGVIIARSGHQDIRKLADLRGKRIAASSRESFGGYQAQAYELLQMGIDPEKDVLTVETGMPHDRVIEAVLSGRADAGFVRTGLIEQMQAEGRLKTDDLTLLKARSTPVYPYQLSTRLYPEWALAAMPWVHTELARQVAAAMLSMPWGGETARAAGIQGFTIPGDYRSVDDVMRALHAPPYDAIGEYGLREFWERHQRAITAAVLMLILLLNGLVIALLYANRRMKQEHQELTATDEQLRASNSRQRILLDAIGEGVFGIDLAGDCTFINPAALKMLGYREAEVLGKNCHTLFHHHHADGRPYAPTDCPVYQTTQDGKLRTVEDWFWCKESGQGIPVRLTAAPKYRDGELRGAVVVFADISEQRRMLDELAEHRDLLERRVAERTGELEASNRRLQETQFVMDSIGVGIEWLDADSGQFTYMNRHAAAMIGYEPHEILGLHVPDIDPKFPEEAFRAGLAELRRAGSLVVESVHQARDGRLVPVELALYYLPAQAGSSARVIAFVTDITDRIEHARQITAMQVELAKRAEAAEAATRAKGAFLANMSHEIRTPLNAVLGLARIGYRDSEGRGQMRDTFGRILDAGEHLLGVINDVLDYSKIEAGKFSIEIQPLRLSELIANAGSFVSGAARQKGLDFQIDIAAPLPEWVSGDAQRLQQVLINLFSNAVKFTASGQVKLRVTRSGELTRFVVCDTGIGMSADQQARLFSPFEQADNSTTRTFGGTGLGLAISRNLAGLMGGDIEVESQPGQGAAFTLSLALPVASAPATPVAVTVSERLPLSGYRILAAEDVEVNRLILEDILTHAGAKVDFACHGQEAVEHIAAAPSAFDIVLMDVQMPVMDGFEATRQIRLLAPALPIIGLTAHALAEERRKCLDAGMANHVTKPIDTGQLIAAILQQTPVASATPAASDTPASLIDWRAYDLAYGKKPALAAKLIETAIRTMSDKPAALRAAGAGEWAHLAELAHSLKGAAGSLKSSRLYQAAAETEQAARAKNPATGEQAVELASLLEAFLAALNERRK